MKDTHELVTALAGLKHWNVFKCFIECWGMGRTPKIGMWDAKVDVRITD
jgi:hypothetical protein